MQGMETETKYVLAPSEREISRRIAPAGCLFHECGVLIFSAARGAWRPPTPLPLLFFT